MNASPDGPVLVLFDLDGTLVDGQHSVIATFEVVLPAFGFAVPSRAVMRSVIGRSLPEAIGDLLGPSAPAEAMADAYRRAFHEMRARPGYAEPVYAGVDETLRRLARRDDVVLGTATGKALRGIHWMIEKNGWDGVFSVLQGADTAPSKPAPDMVLNACRAAHISPSRTLVFGDSVYDMQMAVSAGATPVGVSWGYGAPDTLLDHGAARVIDHFREVERVIDGFARIASVA
jgi:phosphoglycolate phosphatase